MICGSDRSRKAIYTHAQSENKRGLLFEIIKDYYEGNYFTNNCLDAIYNSSFEIPGSVSQQSIAILPVAYKQWTLRAHNNLSGIV
jgi:hypothetical protein